MTKKISLPKRKSYSLSQAVEYINRNSNETITILDLFHYIKHFELRTVCRMSGFILTEKAFLTSLCENAIIKGKPLHNLGIQYYNNEYSSEDIGGSLKILKQSFSNDFLKLTFNNSLIDETAKDLYLILEVLTKKL